MTLTVQQNTAIMLETFKDRIVMTKTQVIQMLDETDDEDLRKTLKELLNSMDTAHYYTLKAMDVIG